jgi:protease IV
LEELSDALREIADDPDVKGVVFLLKDLALTLAQAQSFGALLARFRTWDAQCNPGQLPKRVVVHLEQVSSASYVLACAADEILLTPLTEWNVLGLRVAPTYLKETLAHLGVEMDVVKIAPWKTAADQLSRSEMSAEERAQYNWLLDSWYDDIVSAIANGRKLPAALVRELIDGAPWGGEQAVGYGLADGVCYEDELPVHLGSSAQPASVKPYGKIYKLLYRRPRRRAPQSIGVISLSGAIMPGNSRSFPVPLPILGDETIGSSSAQQLIRAARTDDSLAAVILHVDSPGGSALASDLIWRELTLLNQAKPLVVYMGNVAASGGYYIAAPGRKIVAQRATLTGSIGVITSKPVFKESYAKVGAHRESIQRGDHADLYDDGSRWNEDSRAKVVESATGLSNF